MLKKLIISFALAIASQFAVAQKSLIILEWEPTQGPYLIFVSDSADGPWVEKYYLGHGETTIRYSTGARACFKIRDSHGGETEVRCAGPGNKTITWN